ncbi:hypothetical protein MGYG_04344 [Nannizzia gypsea CBS 118893]|uniref:Uncharacterized protein n=1 Tax=Arthroderma gypseum (strain ATCC MYA-4604 / CBS 118893) TaxID=535722 RepID=E4USI6_ARTGP|nr:hypothetical protein MGYG_04344 [Nannizzia gypsea CBS 118893]EFR01337.1 hypothetical protein MGYG_04344 [Nannizzia gypsea CBS 118893]
MHFFIAAVAAPNPAYTAQLSTALQVREGQEVSFIPGLSTEKRANNDGYHNFCNGPCTGYYCTLGANPQCCVTNNGCGCCWYMDGAAYYADTKPTDIKANHGGMVDAGSTKSLADKAAPHRQPASQYRVGGSKSKVH